MAGRWAKFTESVHHGRRKNAVWLGINKPVLPIHLRCISYIDGKGGEGKGREEKGREGKVEKKKLSQR